MSLTSTTVHQLAFESHWDFVSPLTGNALFTLARHSVALPTKLCTSLCLVLRNAQASQHSDAFSISRKLSSTIQERIRAETFNLPRGWLQAFPPDAHLTIRPYHPRSRSWHVRDPYTASATAGGFGRRRAVAACQKSGVT